VARPGRRVVVPEPAGPRGRWRPRRGQHQHCCRDDRLRHLRRTARALPGPGHHGRARQLPRRRARRPHHAVGGHRGRGSVGFPRWRHHVEERVRQAHHVHRRDQGVAQGSQGRVGGNRRIVGPQQRLGGRRHLQDHRRRRHVGAHGTERPSDRAHRGEPEASRHGAGGGHGRRSPTAPSAACTARSTAARRGRRCCT
jgi:hypothetical protein